MTSPKPPVYTDVTRTLAALVSAHQAVVQGVATHAQKERARREARQNKLETERKLMKGIAKS